MTQGIQYRVTLVSGVISINGNDYAIDALSMVTVGDDIEIRDDHNRAVCRLTQFEDYLDGSGNPLGASAAATRTALQALLFT